MKRRRGGREEFREKSIEYLQLVEPVFNSYPKDEEFTEICKYIEFRKKEEYRKIKDGESKEIEVRYDRYVDYG